VLLRDAGGLTPDKRSTATRACGSSSVWARGRQALLHTLTPAAVLRCVRNLTPHGLSKKAAGEARHGLAA
jgi:hypothetical protein